MRICAYLGPLILLSAAAFGQTADSGAKFEAADVHPSPHNIRAIVQGPFHSGDRYEIRYASMVDLVRIAYNIDPEKVYGGPSWLEMDRFDVVAKTPAGSTAASRALMLEALLAERFNLVVHKDTKPMEAWALTAKHFSLKPSDGGQTGCDFKVDNPNAGGPPKDGGPISLPVISYTCHNTTIQALADAMPSIPAGGQYLNNKPVVDQTELKGSYDFTIHFTPKIPAGIATTGENIPFPDAVEKQLGLNLEMSTIPMPGIVVDSVNEKPTPNPPETAKVFPPLPAEFEVAEIKPSPPDTSGGRGGPRPEVKNGRLYVPNITLKNLIQVAWDINSDDLLSGTQKWMDDDRFDLIAKAPAGVALGELTQTRTSIPVNLEALRPMIRALVIDRFKLKFHMEDRPISAYTLSAAKPKMKKAEPGSRTKWEEGAAPNSKNANSSLGRMVTCHNVTMTQFVEMLPGIAPGYIHTNVVDATGLEGGWDFTFSFSPVGVLQLAGRGGGDAGRGGEGGAPGSDASEPSNGLSLFEALNRQLGLKLEQQKRPTPVLVIDHCERKPVDN